MKMQTNRPEDYEMIVSFLQMYNQVKVMNYNFHNFANHTMKLPENNMSSSKNCDLTCWIRLNEIASLPENWNGYGASVFNDNVIQMMRNILCDLPKPPDIFPIADGSIQFEYEKPNGDYLEFELREDGSIAMYQEKNGETMENELSIAKDEISIIIEVVNNFYGQQV